MDNNSDIRPRARMAMAGQGGNSLADKDYPGSRGVTHVPPSEGRMAELGDHERGIRAGTAGSVSGQSHGRQPAPDHGKAGDHFKRDGKV